MERVLEIGDIRVGWLSGGAFAMDGGAMFGVVPKALWAKKYPSEDNYVRLLSSPLLLETPGGLIVVESGIGNRLTDKQKAIFRVSEEWDVPASLVRLGHSRQDVTAVILTHCDFDHAGGVTMIGDSGDPELTFPRARHLVQRAEWEDARNPNQRASHTYWEQNFQQLGESENLVLVDGSYDVVPGVSVRHTGGHTRGHQVVEITSRGQTGVHMGDLLPTHAHVNPLWVMAFDNFPLETIEQKRALQKRYIAEDAWFLFYHDPFMRACRLDPGGQIIETWEP